MWAKRKHLASCINRKSLQNPEVNCLDLPNCNSFMLLHSFFIFLSSFISCNFYCSKFCKYNEFCLKEVLLLKMAKFRHFSSLFQMKRFVCTICCMTFARKQNLSDHIVASHHIGEKVYSCHCGETFKSRGQRDYHKRLKKCAL